LGRIISLATLGSSITLANQITANTFTNTGSSWIIQGTTAGTYILNSPYSYSPSTFKTTVTPAAGQAISLTVDSATTYGTGFKIYSSTSSITQDPVYDAMSKRLTIVTSGLGLTSVYSPTDGKPIKITVDGSDFDEGNGFTWDGVNKVVTQTQSGITVVWSWTSGGTGGDIITPPLVDNPPADNPPADNSPVVGGSPAIMISNQAGDIPLMPPPIGTTTALPKVVTDNSRIITGGIIAIAFILGIVTTRKEIQKRTTPNNHLKPKKWKAPKWKKPKIKW